MKTLPLLLTATLLTSCATTTPTTPEETYCRLTAIQQRDFSRAGLPIIDACLQGDLAKCAAFEAYFALNYRQSRFPVIMDCLNDHKISGIDPVIVDCIADSTRLAERIKQLPIMRNPKK